MPTTQLKLVNFGLGKASLATVGYRLYNADGSANGFRITAGITERPAATGIYGADVSFPDGFRGEIRWDTGEDTPVYASETVDELIQTAHTKLDTIDDFLDTEIAAIKSKTDNLPVDPADASDIAASFTTVNSKLDVIDDFLDTEVAAILAAVDTEVAAIKAKTDNLPSAIKKNTALNNFEFVLYDNTDHVTPKIGVTVTAQRSIDGGAFAACANAVTEVSNGVYKINLAASDLNGDFITFKFSGTGADTRFVSIYTVAA